MLTQYPVPGETQYPVPGDGSTLYVRNSGAPIKSYTAVNGTNQTLLIRDMLGNVLDSVGPSVTSTLNGYWQQLQVSLIALASTGTAQITVSDTVSSAPGQTSALPSSLTAGGVNAEITTNKQLPPLSSDTINVNSAQSLTPGQSYKLAYLNLSAVPATATQPIVSALWKLGIGRTTGVLDTVITLGTISTGGAATPFTPIVPLADGRPSILAPASGTVQVTINRLDTGSWAANSLLVGFHAIFVPSAF